MFAVESALLFSCQLNCYRTMILFCLGKVGKVLELYLEIPKNRQA